jgi:hypothetical protein
MTLDLQNKVIYLYIYIETLIEITLGKFAITLAAVINQAVILNVINSFVN